MTDDSFGPAVCRVCLSGETSIPYMGSKGGEPLISACHCKGTMGLYHKSCLEHWLYMSHTTYCEICNFRFQYGTKNQSICAYIRLKGWRERGYRNLPSDFFSTLCVSPMPLITIYYFIQAETVPLFIIALVIFATISFLYIITIWFHVMQFFSWQEHHKLVYIIDQSEDIRSLNCDSFFPKLKRSVCCFTSIRATMNDEDIETASSSESSGGDSYNSESSNSSSNSVFSTVNSSVLSYSPGCDLNPYVTNPAIHTPLPFSSTPNSDRNASITAYIDDSFIFDVVPAANFSEIDLDAPRPETPRSFLRISDLSQQFQHHCMDFILPETNI